MKRILLTLVALASVSVAVGAERADAQTTQAEANCGEEFPDNVRLASTGDALEVNGMLCSEGDLIGRMLVSETEARRVASQFLLASM